MESFPGLLAFAKKDTPAQPASALPREVGVVGATMMGLGSILGTGVFVSIGLAAAAAGPAVVLAIPVAALVAVCNGLSSAQLAANHPLSGGTYEYGYRWLSPSLGFTAGWMFLCAKSASAATAALGFSGYLLQSLGLRHDPWLISLALVALLVLTGIVLSGIRRSNLANIATVSLTLLALLAFIFAGLPVALNMGTTHLSPFFAPIASTLRSSSDASALSSTSPVAGFLEATALMFVAYTGYGRIATLAEEVKNPRRTIPLAIVVTLGLSMFLYSAVGMIAVGAAGIDSFAVVGLERVAPLEIVSRQFGFPGVANLVAIGAITAMLGVLLNLILGLSRVVLAMARRRDLPRVLARVHGDSATPASGVLLVGMLIAGIVLIGNVRTTWSFSAFTVLIYYSITNLAAIRLKPSERLYHPGFAWLGLGSCLFLAFWVDRSVWLVGSGLILAGLVWHQSARYLATSNR